MFFAVVKGGCPARHCAGNRNGCQRPARGNGLVAALGIQACGGCPRGTAAAVKGVQFLRGCIVYEPEIVAANAAHVGIDHRKHGGCGNGRIHGSAACAQDVAPCLGGQIVGACDHAPQTQRVAGGGKGKGIFVAGLHANLLLACPARFCGVVAPGGCSQTVCHRKGQGAKAVRRSFT